MIGATGPSAKAVQIPIATGTEKTETNKIKRDGVTETSLREMRTQGAKQFQDEHKKSPLVSYFISKTDEIYKSHQSKAFLTEQDFIDRIKFKFGIPLVVLDFIDFVVGSDLIRTAQTYINPQHHIDRFDAGHDNEFAELKGNIDEDFLPYIFYTFNALGNIGRNEFAKNTPLEEKESKQYCTLDSVKRNLPKVFGLKNDFFAEIFFRYISNHAPIKNVVNFEQFFRRLMVFWPKKEIIPDFEDKATREWRERNAR